MPESGNSEQVEQTPSTTKKKMNIKASAITKVKRKNVKKSKNQDLEPVASNKFDYNTVQNEETKTLKTNAVIENDSRVYEEVKDLRSKIRVLEADKRALREENIRIKQDSADEIRKALAASNSEDQQIDLLKVNIGELESK